MQPVNGFCTDCSLQGNWALQGTDEPVDPNPNARQGQRQGKKKTEAKDDWI